MKRICLSVFICLFLLTVSCANLDQESRLDNSMTVIKADAIKFEELDSTQDGIYNAASSDNISVISRILFQDNSLTDEIDFSKVSLTSTKYYQYDRISLRELEYNTENLGIYNPYITPLYVNPSNELFLWDESDHLFLGKDESIFIQINDVSNRIIASTETLPWLMIDRSAKSLNSYALYNLDNGNSYTFSFEYKIEKFYKNDDLVVIAYISDLDPNILSYRSYIWKDTNNEDDVQSIDNIKLIQEMESNSNTVVNTDNKESVLILLPNCIIPNEELMLEQFDISVSTGSIFHVSLKKSRDEKKRFEGIMENTHHVVAYYKPNELIWLNNEKNQIICTETSTGETKKIISDQDISQIFPFQSKDREGFWVIPTTTSIGKNDKILLYIWADKQIQLQEYHIQSSHFGESTFVDKQGNLYFISADYSQNVPIHQLNVLDPSDPLVYRSSIMETTNSWLNKHEGLITFRKLCENHNQILLTATNSDHLTGLFRIQVNK